MKCKFCKAEMEENEVFCPVCGKHNGEKTGGKITAKKEKKERVKLPLWATICISVLTAAVVGLSAFLIVSNLSPFKDYTGSKKELEKSREKIVARVGDQTLTNAELQVYYWVYIYSFLDENETKLATLGLNLNESFAKQECSMKKGHSWQEYFLDCALDAWHKYATLNIASQGTDFKLNEDEQEYLDNLAETLSEEVKKYGYADGEEMVRTEMGNGTTFDAYIKYTKDTFTGMGYYEFICEEMEFTEEEIAKYYDDNKDYFESYGVKKDDTVNAWVGVRHILLQPETTKDENGKDVITEDAWEACHVKAQALLDSFLAGEQVTEEVFGELAKEHTADSGSKDNGGLYAQFFKGEMVKEFETWSFDATRKKGDTGLVKTTYGYHIMYFIEGESEWHYYADAELRFKAGNKKVDELVEATTMEKYLKNVVLDHIKLA